MNEETFTLLTSNIQEAYEKLTGSPLSVNSREMEERWDDFCNNAKERGGLTVNNEFYPFGTVLVPKTIWIKKPGQ